jgi:hypothetical protein
MEKIIQTLINSWTKGVDTYTHNGSTWLIFTDNKQWVIELTESKTLWYNYNFFKQIFDFTSLDVVDNQQYITKWVEDNIINGSKNTPSPSQTPSYNLVEVLKNGVNHTTSYPFNKTRLIEDAIDNGVKHTITSENRSRLTAENIIENGVRHTIYPTEKPIFVVEDAIENGIKETRSEINITEGEVDDIIQDGVKHTEIGWHQCNNIDDAIKKGVKLTQFNDNENKSWIEGVIKKGVRHTLNTEYMPTSMVEDIIQSGVKEIKGHGFEQQNIIDDIVKDGVKETSLKRGTRPFMVKDTIKNGVKETNPVDVMKFFDNKMEDALQNGVKETKQKKNALLILDTNGRELILESHLVVRDGVKETSHRQFLKTYDVKDTTQDGTEHDRWILDGCDDPVDVVLDNGVKITTPLLAREYTGDIDEVLGNGVKTSHPRQYVGGDIVDKVIDKGVIETHDDVYHHKGRIDGVIKNGIKEIYNYKGFRPRNIDDIIQTGIKETKTPGKDGDILSTIEWMKENKSNSYTKMIDDVIENGEKIIGTYAGGQRQSIKCKSVVEYGTKNPTD